MPSASTSLFPETLRAGGVPSPVSGGPVGVGAGEGSASTLQVVPLSVNEVGDGLLPDREQRKPALTLAPVASAPLQLWSAAVTVVPDRDHSAFQPWLSFCPPAKSKVRLQLLTAAVLLVIVTAPTPTREGPRRRRRLKVLNAGGVA